MTRRLKSRLATSLQPVPLRKSQHPLGSYSSGTGFFHRVKVTKMDSLSSAIYPRLPYFKTLNSRADNASDARGIASELSPILLILGLRNISQI